jgi:hypothetical protein
VKRFVRYAVLAAVVLLAPARGLAQNYVFGPNVRVNDDSPGMNFHSVYSPGQHCVAARGDTVYLVWRDDRLDSHIYFARSNDAGQHFLSNVRVDNTPSGCAGIIPSMAVDGSGTIHVSWNNYNSADHQFAYYAKSTDGGQSFLPPVRACDSLYRSQASGPSIAVSRSGRHVYVVRYQRSNPPAFTSYQIFLSRSTDGGATFPAPDTRVSLDSTKDMLYPTVAAFGDSVVLVAWLDDDTARGIRDVFFARSLDAGASFAPLQILNDTLGGPRLSSYPSINVDSASGVYVLFSGGPNGLGLGLSVSNDTGASFSHDQDVPNSSSGQHPSLFVSPGGQLYVSWYSTDVSGPGEWFAFSPDGGYTFLPVVTPSDVPVTDSTSPDLGTVTANERGRVFVAWGDNRYDPWGFNDDIVFSTGVMSSVEDTSKLSDTTLRCEVMTNPAFGTAAIRYCLPARGHVSLEVYDQSGRRVRVLERGNFAAGPSERIWSGRDDAGKSVATGVYFVRLSTRFGNRSRKVMLIM